MYYRDIQCCKRRNQCKDTVKSMSGHHAEARLQYQCPSPFHNLERGLIPQFCNQFPCIRPRKQTSPQRRNLLKCNLVNLFRALKDESAIAHGFCKLCRRTCVLAHEVEDDESGDRESISDDLLPIRICAFGLVVVSSDGSYRRDLAPSLHASKHHVQN
jgi:hypothetical protein